MSYYDLDKSGDIDNKTEILEEHNYYPFGLKHKGYNQIVNTENEHKFRFNLTEFDDDFDLNWYNMPLRHQDPTTGRWNGIDPVTHFSSSTYAGYNNNPVSFADPSGAIGDDVICAIRTEIGAGLSNKYIRNGIKAFKFGNKVRKIAGGNDWFRSKEGDLIWKDSNKKTLNIKGRKYKNAGTTANVPNIDGTYVVYYQNIFLGISNTQITEEIILSNSVYLDKIMYSRNLTDLSRVSLMISVMHRSTGIAAEVIFDIATTIAPVPKLGLLKHLPKLNILPILPKINVAFAASHLINIIPEGRLANHIFSGRPGKLLDTVLNRNLITDLTNNNIYSQGVDTYGKSWYARILEDGTQLYGYAQNGIVKGAGVNQTPVDLITRYGLR